MSQQFDQKCNLSNQQSSLLETNESTLEMEPDNQTEANAIRITNQLSEVTYANSNALNNLLSNSTSSNVTNEYSTEISPIIGSTNPHICGTSNSNSLYQNTHFQSFGLSSNQFESLGTTDQLPSEFQQVSPLGYNDTPCDFESEVLSKLFDDPFHSVSRDQNNNRNFNSSMTSYSTKLIDSNLSSTYVIPSSVFNQNSSLSPTNIETEKTENLNFHHSRVASISLNSPFANLEIRSDNPVS